MVFIYGGWAYRLRENGVVASTNFPELPTSTPAQVQVRGTAQDLLAPDSRLTCALLAGSSKVLHYISRSYSLRQYTHTCMHLFTLTQAHTYVYTYVLIYIHTSMHADGFAYLHF